MIPKKQEPIKILRGNDVTLLAALYDRNNLGELVALPLADMELNVSVYSPRQGVQTLHYDLASDVTLMLRCDAGTFDEVGVYSLEIKATSEARNIRFAVQTAIKVVNYVEEVHPDGGCEEPYSVVNIPPQVACGAHVRFAQFAGQASAGGGGGASSEEIAALAEKVADFERELNIIEYFVEAQEKTNETTAQELANIGERLSTQAEAIESLQGANEATLADIAKLKEDVAEQGQLLINLEQQVTDNKEEINQQLEQVLSDIDATLTGYVEGLAVLVEKIDTNTANIATLQATATQNAENIAALQQGIGNIDVALTNILGEEV